jgi:ATP-binding cassette subfamily B protein
MERLYRLTLGYFQKRQVGELAGRVNEMENIRQFLTGSALTLVLDAMFSVIYIAVMLVYSVPLTFVALSAVPLMAVMTWVVSPVLRRQLRFRAERYAETQSQFIESLSGIQTIKAQSLETQTRWQWQERYGNYIQAGFRALVISTGLNTVSGFLSRMADIAVLWIGALMVLDHKLSIGQLIAFRIISGYVTAPLLRLAGSWQQFQEVAMSLERLSDILDAPQEQGDKGALNVPLPEIQGSVTYEQVTFSYEGDGRAPQVRNVSFSTPFGAFVGVAGRSGSGKSTLLKLLPALYRPDSGRILVDGYDVTKVELQSLRQQTGVVLQDTLLFDGTVQQNIALSVPDTPAEEIVAAARMVCAHDFIMSLPEGYNTHLGEGGRGLSHGQRQRVVLARMVIARPRILILDEATSALDFPTEEEVCRNLATAFSGRTIFMVTHRLRSLRHANMILYMDGGVLVESGTHEELLKLDGSYAALVRQQEEHS